MRRQTTITVLYEDRRGPSPRRAFGLHDLLVALVADESGVDARELAPRLEARPLKSNNKVLDRCQTMADRIAPDCHPVVAVFDSDRVTRLRGLGGITGAEQIVAAIKENADNPEKIHPVLLERKTESIIEATREVAPELDGPGRFDKALRKRLLDRDIILQAASRMSKEKRWQLTELVPSLGEIAKLVAQLLEQERGDR